MRKHKCNNKTWRVQVLFGVMMSLALVWGHQLENLDHIVLTDRLALLTFVILAIGITALVHISHNVLQRKLDKNEDGVVVVRPGDAARFRILKSGYTRREFMVTWLLIAACNLVVLLGVYPGFFVYDAQTEVIEVFSRTFTTHHPLLHVLMLGGSLAFFNKYFGSYNLGIFFYIFMQMMVMSWIFTYFISFLKKLGAGRKFRGFSALFFGVFPTIVMYTLCSSKDGLFSAFLVLTVVLMLEWEDAQTKSAKRKKAGQVIISAVLMMLFRHNGFYAYLVFAVIIFIAGKVQGNRDRYHRSTFLIAPLLIYFCANLMMTSALHAQGGEHQEMLTVPIQQIARVYYYDSDSFSGEEKEVLFTYLSEEGLSHYTPRISDILKTYFNNEAYDKDKLSFWKLWLRKGLQNPVSYLNGWFLTSYGYWYPRAVINVYQGNTVFTFTYKDSSYFGYEVEEPGTRHSFIPAIDSFYRKLSIEKFQQNIPVLSLLFAPGMYFWLFAYLLMTAAVIRKKEGMYPWLLLLLVWLTVLLGPTYLVRYVIYLWYSLPLLMYTVLLRAENAA